MVWDRDRWLLNRFYHTESADLTMPEFLQALNSMQYVIDELRPKTPEEIMGQIAKQVAEMAALNRARKEAARE